MEQSSKKLKEKAARTESLIWTPIKLVNWLKAYLSEKQIGNSFKTDAEILVAKALNLERLELYLQFDRPVSQSELNCLKSMINRRLKSEPIAYITGKSDFYGLALELNRETLIPRFDTEAVVEYALNLLKSETTTPNKIRILDIGTGSGAISLALAANLSDAQIIGIDISREAIKTAESNFKKHQKEILNKNVEVEFLNADFFDFSDEKPFDMIISNPPYIPSEEINRLDEEVAVYEPNQALDGGNKGLNFYERFPEKIKPLLLPGGHLIFEHGWNQRKEIKEIFSESSEYSFVHEGNDYSNIPRFLCYKANGEQSNKHRETNPNF